MLISSEKTKLLLDSGFSFRRLSERLEKLGVPVDALDAVLITHEHTDHVQCLGTLARKTKVPVFMTYGCADALPASIGRLPKIECFESGASFSIGDILITSFAVSHDAADPVNYTFECGGVKLGTATDFGHCSHLIRTRLAGSNALVIESNYCPEMLRKGPYPPQIQQRIHGRYGHLSNHDVQALLKDISHDALQLVVLTHISRDNNCPDLACRLAREALESWPVDVRVADADITSPVFEVSL
ncbi:MAG: MBL fold metallo-hydrolase [Candidatus Hydrogenedentes bacterium]|nr:MBL fold metallo-hydrolase [Candidatus Hydrogenedentota bacterium]